MDLLHPAMDRLGSLAEDRWKPTKTALRPRTADTAEHRRRRASRATVLNGETR